MSTTALFCTIIVVAWLTLTAFAQFRRNLSKISKIDIFRLIPTWTFFAPNPSTIDYQLVTRDRRDDGSLSTWLQVEIGAPRNCLNFIWNPQKRPKKIFIDAVQSLSIILKSNGPTNHELVSLPYILILNRAASHTSLPAGFHDRQFAVLQTSGHTNKEIQVVYLSQFHRMVPN